MWKMRNTWLIAVLVCGLGVNASTSAETKEECYRRIGKHTNLALGGGTGTFVGGIAGAAVCSAFLGAVFVDLGLSYGTCIAAITLGGTVLCAAAAEQHNNTKEDECDTQTSTRDAQPKAHARIPESAK
jgi:hypothetical protein